MSEQLHHGSCHCGAIRFHALVDVSKASRCNCTICTKAGALGALVRPETLVVDTPEAPLATYQWGSKIGTRYSCPTCHVYLFSRGHLAELGGDFASVNLNALDELDPFQLAPIYWDGRHDNWEGGPRATPWPIFRS